MAENFISRGFKGRARETERAIKERIPPGQYETKDFPVLSAGPTPRTSLERWDFSIYGEIPEDLKWTWDEFRKLPRENVTVDIHCVTKWSKLDTVWTGELDHISTNDSSLRVIHTLTRRQPQNWMSYRRRIDRAMLADTAWLPAEKPLAYTCGSTAVVEKVATYLLELGYEPERIKTERFGPTGD